MPNNKFQISNEIPNYKSQITNKFQISNNWTLWFCKNLKISRTSECSACWSSDCTSKISTTFRRFDKSKHSEVVCVFI